MLPVALAPASFRWLVPPRGGRPFVAALHPAVTSGDRFLAPAMDGRHLVTWRGAGDALALVALPEGVAVTGLALGPGAHLAVLSAGGVHLHDGARWSHFACERPRHAAFGDDGALRVLAGGIVHGVAIDGRARWSTPTDFEEPLVAMGDEVWLVAWGVTQVFAADGTVSERDNDASSTPAGIVRIGDRAVAVMVDDEGARSLLVVGADGCETARIVDPEETYEKRPLAAIGADRLAIGTQIVPLAGGVPEVYTHATHASDPTDAVASDGVHLYALRGGAVSRWQIGSPEELGPIGFGSPLDQDVCGDAVALALPNEVVVVIDGAVAWRAPVPLVRQVRYTRDGAALVVTSREAPMLRVLDAATGAVRAQSNDYKPTALALLGDEVLVADGMTLHRLGPDLVPRGRVAAKENSYGDYLEGLAVGAVDGATVVVARDNGGTFHIVREAGGELALAGTVARGVVQGSSFTLHGGDLVVCGTTSSRVALATGRAVEEPAWADGVAARGGPYVWTSGAILDLAGGTRTPCPLRPSVVMARDGGLAVVLCEGVARP